MHIHLVHYIDVVNGPLLKPLSSNVEYALLTHHSHRLPVRCERVLLMPLTRRNTTSPTFLCATSKHRVKVKQHRLTAPSLRNGRLSVPPTTTTTQLPKALAPQAQVASGEVDQEPCLPQLLCPHPERTRRPA